MTTDDQSRETPAATPGARVPELGEATGSAPFSVSLSIYDWHRLLKDMEEHLRIVNRDWRTTVNLYEMISSQLHGRPVKIIIDEPKAVEKKPAPEARPRVNWWRRVLGGQNTSMRHAGPETRQKQP